MFKFNFGDEEEKSSSSNGRKRKLETNTKEMAKEHFMVAHHLEMIGEDVDIVENAELGLFHLSGDDVEVDM